MFKIMVAFAIGIVLSNLALLALSKNQRQSLFTWISTSPRGRRASTAKTPPRSLSPETKMPNNGPAPVAYNEIFPPSSREALAKAAATLPPAQKGKLKGLEVDQTEFRKNIIPWAADYQECGPSAYTPMEISIEEVKALGDFPDYAELSGVPLPEEYEGFDIEKAKPRPYRPFRWAYHQTMCTYQTPDRPRPPLTSRSPYQTRNKLVARTRKRLPNTNRPTSKPLRGTWQTSPRLPPGQRTGLQRADGNGAAIPVRAISSVLLAQP